MERKSRHHFNWEMRKWRQDRITRLIQEHPGMILPMRVVAHDALHREIQPIDPPQRDLARLVLKNLLSVDNNNDPIINLANQSYFLFTVVEQDNYMSNEAFRLGSHYLDQLLFINENR